MYGVPDMIVSMLHGSRNSYNPYLKDKETET